MDAIRNTARLVVSLWLFSASALAAPTIVGDFGDSIATWCGAARAKLTQARGGTLVGFTGQSTEQQRTVATSVVEDVYGLLRGRFRLPKEVHVEFCERCIDGCFAKFGNYVRTPSPWQELPARE